MDKAVITVFAPYSGDSILEIRCPSCGDMFMNVYESWVKANGLYQPGCSCRKCLAAFDIDLSGHTFSQPLAPQPSPTPTALPQQALPQNAGKYSYHYSLTTGLPAQHVQDAINYQLAKSHVAGTFLGPKKCECGAEKIGSSHHFDWCPKYKPNS